MPKSFAEELNHANKLMREGKFGEALKIIDSLEKNSELKPEDRLTLPLLKGKMYTLTQQYEECFNLGKVMYQLSKSLSTVNEILTSLLFKANCVFLGRYEKALEYLKKAENVLNSLTDMSPLHISRISRGDLFFFYLCFERIFPH